MAKPLIFGLEGQVMRNVKHLDIYQYRRRAFLFHFLANEHGAWRQPTGETTRKYISLRVSQCLPGGSTTKSSACKASPFRASGICRSSSSSISRSEAESMRMRVLRNLVMLAQGMNLSTFCIVRGYKARPQINNNKICTLGYIIGSPRWLSRIESVRKARAVT